MLIYNEDYNTCIEYLNISMDLCLKNIIYLTENVNDGVYKGDKTKAINYYKNMKRLSKIKIENEMENSFGNQKIKKAIINIVYIYFYRGICYENFGKMKSSIKCYYQCLWFLNHFFINSHRNLSTLIKCILDRCLEFKEILDYMNTKIKYIDLLQLKMRNQMGRNNENKNHYNKNKNSKILFSRKFDKLVNKLDKLKIYELDTVNKFEIKKNIKELNKVKREGKDKNIFLSDIRLLDVYLRDDFKDIINHMDKIKCYDMDYATRDNIQKLIRKIYFEKSQRNLKYKPKKRNSLYYSSRNISNDNYKNKRYKFLNDQLKMNTPSVKNSMLSKDKTKIHSLYNSYNTIRKNQSVSYGYLSVNNKEKKVIKKDIYKKGTLKKSKKIRFNSIGSTNRIKLYNVNEDLTSFFNQKYIDKRNYIKKLEERELSFQKYYLKLKNIPKNPIPVFNKEIIKQNASESFQKKMTLLVSTPMNWKDNFSEEEVKNIMAFDKLENIVIKSLDSKAFVKLKEEEKKQQKSTIISENSGYTWVVNNKENNNKSIINELNIDIEEIKKKKILENKNYQKILMESRHRNERNQPNYNNSCSACRIKREGKYSIKYFYKRPASSTFLNLKK